MLAEVKSGKNNDYHQILEYLVKDIKYGNVLLIIQDGKVIQIDKTEKIRL